MADPKYYADDKAILDLMTQLLEQQEQARAEGALGASTIGLDALGLKAAGTMGRLATKADDIPLVKQPINEEQADFYNVIGEVEKGIYNPERYKFDEPFFEIPQSGDPLYPYTRFTPSPKKSEEAEQIYQELNKLEHHMNNYHTRFGKENPIDWEYQPASIDKIARKLSKDPELYILVKQKIRKNINHPNEEIADNAWDFYIEHLDQLVAEERKNFPIHAIENRRRNAPFPDDYDIEDIGSMDNYEYLHHLSGSRIPPRDDPTFHQKAAELIGNKYFNKPKQYDFVDPWKADKILNYDLARDTSLRAKKLKKDLETKRDVLQRDTTDKLLAEQRRLGQEAFKQQQRGYGELAAATIPFVGGADMMHNAYEQYMDAQTKMDELYEKMTPEQKVKVDKMKRERDLEKMSDAIDAYPGDF